MFNLDRNYPTAECKNVEIARTPKQILESRKRELEIKLDEINAGLEVFKQHPEFADAMEKLSKALR